MIVKAIKIDKKDNVLVLLEDANSGDVIECDGSSIELLEDIKFAHKVALRDIDEKDPVFKYGEEIGYALKAIRKGGWIHDHNMGCDRGRK